MRLTRTCPPSCSEDELCAEPETTDDEDEEDCTCVRMRSAGGAT